MNKDNKKDNLKENYLYNDIKELIYNSVGICIADKDSEEIKRKIESLLPTFQCQTIEGFFYKLLSDNNEIILGELANRITTNYSYFNREESHLNHLKDEYLPDLIAKQRQNNKFELNIWSAACSTGEEIYTIMILLRQILGNCYESWDINAFGTDISTRVLEEAKKGVYHQDRLRNYSEEVIEAHFNKLNDDKYEVKRELMKNVEFRTFNLKSSSYIFEKPLHFIFCRNVFIYFDKDMINYVCGKMHRGLEKDGLLFVGVSEVIDTKNNLFEFVAPGIYRKK